MTSLQIYLLAAPLVLLSFAAAVVWVTGRSNKHHHPAGE